MDSGNETSGESKLVPVALAGLMAVVLVVLGVTVERGLLAGAAFSAAICIVGIAGGGLRAAFSLVRPRSLTRPPRSRRHHRRRS
jgi:hypothetical protein